MQNRLRRTPDSGGLKYWLSVLDGGAGLDTVASGFWAARNLKPCTAAPPAADYVSRLYSNVLHHTPDQDSYDYWVKPAQQRANQQCGGAGAVLQNLPKTN